MSQRLNSKQGIAVGNLLGDIELLLHNFEDEINPLLSSKFITESPLPEHLKKKLSKALNAIDNAYVNLSIVNDDITKWENNMEYDD